MHFGPSFAPHSGVCGPSTPMRAAGESVSRRWLASATDALEILKTAAAGQSNCGVVDPCICDVNDSGSVTASDALQTLQNAIGLPAVSSCAC